MNAKKYQVQVNGVVREYQEGTTFEDIAKDFQNQYQHQIVLVFQKDFVNLKVCVVFRISKPFQLKHDNLHYFLQGLPNNFVLPFRNLSV